MEVMRVMMVTTTIYIDAEIKRKAREKRLNISRVCEAALRTALGGMGMSPSELDRSKKLAELEAEEAAEKVSRLSEEEKKAEELNGLKCDGAV